MISPLSPTDEFTIRTRRHTKNPCRVYGSSTTEDNIVVVKCHSHTTIGCNLQNNPNSACRPVRCSHNSKVLTIDCECDNTSPVTVNPCS